MPEPWPYMANAMANTGDETMVRKATTAALAEWLRDRRNPNDAPLPSEWSLAEAIATSDWLRDRVGERTSDTHIHNNFVHGGSDALMAAAAAIAAAFPVNGELRADGTADPLASAYIEGLRDAWTIVRDRAAALSAGNGAQNPYFEREAEAQPDGPMAIYGYRNG